MIQRLRWTTSGAFLYSYEYSLEDEIHVREELVSHHKEKIVETQKEIEQLLQEIEELKKKQTASPPE